MTHANVKRFVPWLQNLLLVFLFVMLMAVLTSPVMAKETPAGDSSAREEMVSSMATTVLAILHDTKKPHEERNELLERGFTNVVDIEWIARFVLGNNWRTASEEQKQRYLALYHDYLIGIYVANYAQSNDRKIADIKIMGVRDAEEGRFVAETELVMHGMKNMRVSYLVHESTDGYRIVDVVIEGVSLLASHRAEFAQLVAGGGVSKVIAKLERATGREQKLAMAVN